jgi:hypothetical protein
MPNEGDRLRLARLDDCPDAFGGKSNHRKTTQVNLRDSGIWDQGGANFVFAADHLGAGGRKLGS